MNLGALKAEFPQSAVHWRAQTVTKQGDKALALAYIDARDVMDRLDEVVGPENWQDEYTSAGGRTVCRIGIRINDEWVWKSDGAGDTAVEAEKGAISDAFKRCAVKWGIGRYLYDLPTPWVPCESREFNGKQQFRRFTADPWQFVQTSGPDPSQIAAGIVKGLGKCDSLDALKAYWAQVFADVERLPADQRKRVTTEKDRKKDAFQQAEMAATP